MEILRKNFGTLSSGKKAHIFVLEAGDLKLCISDFGATLLSLFVPSRDGKADDILLGFSTLDSYIFNKPHFGSTIGRFANRIAGAAFSLDGRNYTLDKNNGENSLHGGGRGFEKYLWKADAYKEKDGVFVSMELKSPDGDGGYPGNLSARVSYGLTKSNELIADYRAKVDAPCPVNLTNHAYFNLAGEGRGDILSHEVTLYASSYIAVNKQLIPTGERVPVNGGPFDFRVMKPVGRDIQGTGGGYDHCFTVDGEEGALRPCAEVFEPGSKRTMKLFTTQPGVQFYTGNFLDGIPGKAGSMYNMHSGFCLETQHFPDSPNQPGFPSAIFGPDRNYHEKAVFSFSW